MTAALKYHCLADHYEKCFKAYGPQSKGVDWPNEADALARHRVMRELWGDHEKSHVNLIDVGCGYGAFLNYLLHTEQKESFAYTGIDLSDEMIRYAQEKNPGYVFQVKDILSEYLENNSFDYGVMNGVLTEKLHLSFKEMEEFAYQMIQSLFNACRYGIAFNVMNSQVDWARLDLFHLPFDRLATFLTEKCSRHYVFRANYGLYEYTTYVYKAT